MKEDEDIITLIPCPARKIYTPWKIGSFRVKPFYVINIQNMRRRTCQ
jgi:hypothetical protein